MPNLLIATGIFHPEAGGPATYLYHLLPRLQAHGYTVRLITYGEPSPDDDAYPYPVTRISRAAPYPVRAARYAAAARPLLRWADAAYLHSQGLPLAQPPWGRRIPRVLKVVGDSAWERAIRRRWVPPTTDIDAFQVRRYRHPLVQANKYTRNLEIRRQTDGVIVPSAYLQNMVVGWGMPGGRIEVVHNALPPGHSPPDGVTQAQARARLGLDTTRPILLTVARLVPWKGIDDLILALAAVPDVQLVVAGDGTERGALEQYAGERGVADRVTFLGRVPQADVPLYMRAANYVGLYSGYEGLSHVLIESLRAGTPVIASDKGGNPEVVQHNANGLLVPYNDPYALAAALVTAFAPGQHAALAANTQRGLERFDYNRMVMNTVGALVKLTGIPTAG